MIYLVGTRTLRPLSCGGKKVFRETCRAWTNSSQHRQGRHSRKRLGSVTPTFRLGFSGSTDRRNHPDCRNPRAPNPCPGLLSHQDSHTLHVRSKERPMSVTIGKPTDTSKLVRLLPPALALA